MEAHFDQIEQALEQNLFYLAFYSVLALPSICGAMESENGRDSGNKYRAWFERWVAQKYLHPPLGKITVTGGVCYSFRNRMLHQGRNNHQDLGFSKIAFTEPGSPISIRNGVMNDVLCLDLDRFCRDVIEGAGDWLASVKNEESFKTNYGYYFRRYPNGITPVAQGFPMIGYNLKSAVKGLSCRRALAASIKTTGVHPYGSGKFY